MRSTPPLSKRCRPALSAPGRSPDCRAVLITGAGRGFCAGADLANRAFAPGDARPDLGEALEKGLNPIIRGIRNLPKPVVCAVNGPAAGAGANIALACDIVLAAKSAQFLQAFARIGLIPDAGGTFVLPRLVGDARARALMMLAEPIGAEQAQAIGMIYRAVDDEDLMGEAHTIAERLAAGSTHALGLMKRALAASPTNSFRRPTRPRARPAAGGRSEATTIWKACAPFWTSGPRISTASQAPDVAVRPPDDVSPTHKKARRGRSAAGSIQRRR